MPRRKQSPNRSSERRQGAALQLLCLGIVLVTLPFFIGKSPLMTAFKPVSSMGWLFIVGGAALFWWARMRSPSTTKTAPGPKFRQAPDLASPAKRIEPSLLDQDAPQYRERFDLPAQNDREVCTERPTQWDAQVFRVIEWRRFEALVEALFAQAGFATKAQSHGADGGVDIWLFSKNDPERPAGIVQCKHWSSKPVGVDKVRELRGVMAAHSISRGQFATTSEFTSDAQAFAKQNGINLLNARGLLALIGTRSPEQQQALLDVALEGDYSTPTCASCGTKMVQRTPKKGGTDFWGCRNYPGCKFKIHMRTESKIRRLETS